MLNLICATLTKLGLGNLEVRKNKLGKTAGNGLNLKIISKANPKSCLYKNCAKTAQRNRKAFHDPDLCMIRFPLQSNHKRLDLVYLLTPMTMTYFPRVKSYRFRSSKHLKRNLRPLVLLAGLG